uniref:N-acetylglucosaminylphosphatidylinositol deacetylase n=1 Tax=Plectus sambesii TaxID=2011161 RepID=A0A914VKC9_9BILA
MLWLLIAFICVAVFVLGIHWLLADDGARRLTNVRRVLLVTAHPDDETMFFAPSILGLRAQGCDVYLLCLSMGDFRHGQGATRKRELWLAANCLGIDPSAVTALDFTHLPDSPSAQWSKKLVSDVVLRYVEALEADTVLTFDEGGVSGHPNHIALFRGVQSLYTHGLLPQNTQVLVLETVNLLRKYSGLVDVWPSVESSTFCYVSRWPAIIRALAAMRHHWSQLVWFRLLYVLFSRYMVVNTLKRIAMDRRFYRRQSRQCVG